MASNRPNPDSSVAGGANESDVHENDARYVADDDVMVFHEAVLYPKVYLAAAYYLKVYHVGVAYHLPA